MAYVFKTMRPMGLIALVLAMAFSATSAQAETGAHWNINGVNYNTVSGTLSVEVQANIEGSFGALLTKVGPSNVQILCTTIKLRDALLKANGGATGAIHFDGCITKLNGGGAIAVCEPHSPGAALGLIETNALDALIVLHNSKTVDLIELLPVVGSQPFVMLILGPEGEENECPIGELFNVTGKFFLKDAQEELLSEKLEHLIIQGPLSALLFGGISATIDGSVKASLIAPHQSMTWSGVAA